jgi:sterol desaturase/sphingolipid hydroxylase (fatty acid hydroxylase superfamily)
METAILIASLGAIALAERRPSLRYRRSRFLRRHFATDLVYLATGAIALGLAMRGAAERVAGSVGAPSLVSAALPPALVVGLAVVLHDLGSYLSHWLLHRGEFAWRLHQVHHSSRHLDWLATFRGHVLEHALRNLLSPVALLLAGFPPYAVAGSTAIYAAWAAFNHSNLRLAPSRLELLLITPRLHRLHHVPATSGCNLGTIFSTWDRLRGTLVVDADAASEPLGVPGAVASYPQSWLPQLVAPFRRRTAPPERPVRSGRHGLRAGASRSRDTRSK